MPDRHDAEIGLNAPVAPGSTAPAAATDADEEEAGRIGYGHYGRWTPLALAALLVVALLAIGIAGQTGQTGQRDGARLDAQGGAQIGAPAPEFALPLLDGRTLGLHDLHGKTVVLNFWASWCEPCREELPALQRIAVTSGDDVAVVGVGLRNDDDADARAFVERFGLTFAVGRDTGAGAAGPRGPIEQAYGVIGAPTTIIIAPDGTITTIALGPQSEEQLRALLGSEGVSAFGLRG